MTWELQAQISDDVYRVSGPSGEAVWGIDNDSFDVDDPQALGTAEVELPTGRRSLLLVPTLPGGLVLDVVRAYQGLTDAELCTLFLGIVTELRGCSCPEQRLSLKAFALEAAGRPGAHPRSLGALGDVTAACRGGDALPRRLRPSVGRMPVAGQSCAG